MFTTATNINGISVRTVHCLTYYNPSISEGVTVLTKYNLNNVLNNIVHFETTYLTIFKYKSSSYNRI